MLFNTAKISSKKYLNIFRCLVKKCTFWNLDFDTFDSFLSSFQKQKNDTLYISYSFSLIYHLHDYQLYLLFPTHMKNHKQMLFYKLFETYKNLKSPRGHSPNFMANIFTLHMHIIGNRTVIYTSMDIYNEIYILPKI